MNENELEGFLKLTENFYVILSITIWVLALWKRQYLNCYLIWYVALITCFLCAEWLLVNIIFVKKYGFIPYVSPFLDKFGIQDMNFTSPLNYLIKFIFLSLFFRDLMKTEVWKKFFQYLVYGLVVFELVQVFVFNSYQGYDSLSSTVKNIFILFGCGLFFYKFYNTDSGTLLLQKNPYFWIIMGLFIPTLTDFFLELIFFKLYQTDLAQFYRLYLVRNASQIIGFILLGIGIYYSKFLQFLPKNY